MKDFTLEPISDIEVFLTQFFTNGMFILYALSVIIFLVACFILIFKSQANGRYLMLYGLLIYIVSSIIWFLKYPPNNITDYNESVVLPLPMYMFMISLSIFVFIIGFLRFVLWAIRR